MTTETETSTETTATESSAAEPTTTTEATTTETTTEAATPDAGESIDLSKSDETETTETKTEGEEAPDARYGAPEEGTSYEISGLPEGMTIDTEALEAVSPIARELNLSNEGFSKIAGVYAEKVLPMVQAKAIEGIEQRIVAQRTEWEVASRDLIRGRDDTGEELIAKNAAGEVLGFDGLDIKGVQKIAAKALDRVAPEGFRAFLDETGLGVHPQMVAFAYQVGKALGEDTAFETTGSAPKKKSEVDKFYS